MLCRRGRATRACAGPRAFSKGTLHLNGEPIAPHLLRDLNANSAISTLHLIPKPEEKASELLRDLTANDIQIA
jgi:hypothetical protein